MTAKKLKVDGMSEEQNALFDDQYEALPADYDNSPVTIDNWKSFAHNEEIARLWGYYEANKHFTDELESRCATAANFEDLKSEITALISEKRVFIEFACKNMTVE
jgi:hypothetical protein